MTKLPLALLFLTAAAPGARASGDTPVTIKDGGSVVLIAAGLDSNGWTTSKAELRHMNVQGVLTGVQITDGGADRCAGDPKCGIDPSQPWRIRVVYNGRWINITSLNANKGIHITFSPKIAFDQWMKANDRDMRVFGHGDGRRISTISVNGNTSLCAGDGACQVTVTYTTP